MAEPLEYARPARPTRVLALPAMICGVVSGPAGYGLAFVAAHNHLSESAKEALMCLAFFGTLVVVFLFAAVVRAWPPERPTRREWWFTMIGVCAPVAWVVAVLALFVLAAPDL